jgi:transketolase
VLKFDASDPHWPDRDRFVLSAGHGCMLLYSLLYLTGVGGAKGLGIEDLKQFRQVGSKTPGHPEYWCAPGVETTTGPLGQGIATAVGMAVAERMLAARFPGIVDHHTYVLASDGDLMEGLSQESIGIAGHLKLSKLIVFWDDNGITIDGKRTIADNVDQVARFQSAGWNSAHIDGHDPKAILDAIHAAQNSDKPTMIACKTVIGFGLPTHAGTQKAHSDAQGPSEVAGARKTLNWPSEPFVIPDDILAAWRTVGSRGAEKREAWNQAVEALDVKLRAEFERRVRGDLPEDLDQVIDAYKKKLADEKPEAATRKAGEAALNVIGAALPELVTGSADLTPSNNTKFANETEIQADNFSGRYIHWGIREHGMIAACNGIAIHGGFIPSGASFFCFTDYCRPSLRLSALMGIRVVNVFTHDSIGLGEDGPTHQPVEHLASLRAMRAPALALDPGADAPVHAGGAADPCGRKPVRARRLRSVSSFRRGPGLHLRLRLRSIDGGRGAGAAEGEGRRGPGRVDALLPSLLRAAGGLSPLGDRQCEGEDRRRGRGAVRMGRHHRRWALHRHEELWRERTL